MNNGFNVKVKDYAVCYFDLMGQRDGLLRKVREATDLASVQEEIEQVSEAIRNFNNAIYGAKTEIEQHPDNLLRMMCKSEDEIERLLPEIKSLNFGIQQFSDTTVFYVSADNRIGLGIFVSWCLALSVYYLRLVSNGILIRGGISIGRGWEITPSCLYGPVMEDVYRLEGCVADFPRIVMTSKTYQRFQEMDDLDAEELRRQGISAVPPWLKSAELFSKDFDGVHVLDYLSVSSIKRFDNIWSIPRGQIYSMIIQGLRYVRTTYATLMEEASRDMAKVHVARKIALLRSYWLQQTGKICDMPDDEQSLRTNDKSSEKTEEEKDNSKESNESNKA